jgi:hypothetical protein
MTRSSPPTAGFRSSGHNFRSSHHNVVFARMQVAFVASHGCIRPNATSIRRITTLYSSECTLRSSHHTVVFVRTQVAFRPSQRCIRSNASCIPPITTLYSVDHNVVFGECTVVFVRMQVPFDRSHRCIRPTQRCIRRMQRCIRGMQRSIRRMHGCIRRIQRCIRRMDRCSRSDAPIIRPDVRVSPYAANVCVACPGRDGPVVALSRPKPSRGRGEALFAREGAKKRCSSTLFASSRLRVSVNPPLSAATMTSAPRTEPPVPSASRQPHGPECGSRALWSYSWPGGEQP